ncbi:hypothetical protein MTO96_036701 [Rhipicephalus appendiculatus]
MAEPGLNDVGPHGAAPMNPQQVTVSTRSFSEGNSPLSKFAKLYSQPATPKWFTYVLQGFGCSFLDMQPFQFAFPLPSARICATCKIVSARAAMLPCGHTICEFCSEEAGQEVREDEEDVEGDGAPPARVGTCPVDGRQFAEAEVLSLPYGLDQLGRELVHCVNTPSGCPFLGELQHLKEHCLGNCRFRPKLCPRCACAIPASLFMRHSLYCLPR